LLQTGGLVRVYFTFNISIAEKYNDPTNGLYSVLLPSEYVGTTYSYTIMARYEPFSVISKDVFQGFVSFYETKSDETYGDDYATSTYITSKYPIAVPPSRTTPTSDGRTVLYYMLEFLATFATMAQSYQAFPNLVLPIYTYFSTVNNNITVVDFYSNENRINALINNPNENYYQTRIYTTTDVSGISYTLQEITVLYMNQAFTGSGTQSNIQVYVLIGNSSASATPIKTISTSPDVPYMSDSNYPSTTYDQIGAFTSSTSPYGTYGTAVLTTSDWSKYNPTYIYLVERVSNPINPNSPLSMAGCPVYSSNNNVTENINTNTTMNFRAFATFAPTV
jgi:hypothetical protein